MEEWRDIPGYGNLYQASSLGRIKSKARVVSKRTRSGGQMQQFYGERIFEGTRYGAGYRNVHLSVNGKKLCVTVHKLVALAFYGVPDEGMEVCHCNGDAADNRAENLRWDTHYNNNQDRKKHGKYATGTKHPMAKITNEIASKIRNSKESGAVLAKKYGLGQSHISRIKKGKAWK